MTRIERDFQDLQPDIVDNAQRAEKLKKRTRITAENARKKPVKLLDIVHEDGVDATNTLVNLESLVQTIADAYGIPAEDVVVFDLSQLDTIDAAFRTLSIRDQENLVVLKYPNLDPVADANIKERFQVEQRVLDIYYEVQSWYFHTARNHPTKSFIVQVYDQSLKRSLYRAGMHDTLNKVFMTPHVLVTARGNEQ